jgi:hypothetical protein
MTDITPYNFVHLERVNLMSIYLTNEWKTDEIHCKQADHCRQPPVNRLTGAYGQLKIQTRRESQQQKLIMTLTWWRHDMRVEDKGTVHHRK